MLTCLTLCLVGICAIGGWRSRAASVHSPLGVDGCSSCCSVAASCLVPDLDEHIDLLWLWGWLCMSVYLWARACVLVCLWVCVLVGLCACGFVCLCVVDVWTVRLVLVVICAAAAGLPSAVAMHTFGKHSATADASLAAANSCMQR
jgi:hypothetical protein